VLILALDTSSSKGSIAILSGEEVLGHCQTDSSKTYSSQLFRPLDLLLNELSLGPDKFDLYAVAAGPGSFTGLRVGLAAVKAWAEVYRKPIAGISCLEAVATQSASAAPYVVPIFDARRGQVYAAVYKGSDSVEGPGGDREKDGSAALVLEGEERVCTADEFLSTLPGIVKGAAFSILTPEPELLAEALSRVNGSHPYPRDRQVERSSNFLAPFIGKLAYQRALRGELTDSLGLDAHYIRRPDAELNWKRK
jgi:tRNA threonylcarbamoyladenosine biosynthesis protein TsaB